MIRIETNPAIIFPKEHKIARMGMLYAYILCLGICFSYGILRWVQVIGFLPLENLMFQTFRIVVLIIVGVAIGASILIGRSRRFQAVSQMSRSTPVEIDPTNGLGDRQEIILHKNMLPIIREDTPTKKIPRLWKVFERSVFIATGILVLLSILASPVLCNNFFASDCYMIPIFIESPLLGNIIEGLGSLDLVVLLAYGSIKVPLLLRNVMDLHSRVYIGQWHVHESVFGIIWVIIAGLWILFGDYYDRFIGFAFVLQGVFLIGRDHADVEKFKFAEKRGTGD